MAQSHNYQEYTQMQYDNLLLAEVAQGPKTEKANDNKPALTSCEPELFHSRPAIFAVMQHMTGSRQLM